MKQSVYLLAVLLFFTISSCSKKKETPYDPSAALAAVVKTVSHSNTGTTDTYTYDVQGRIQLLQNSTGSKISYEYVDSSLTQTNFDATGTVVSITHFVLDSFGLVSESVTTGAGGAVLAYHNYTFDWERQLTAQYNYTANHDVNGKSEWVWGGGNLFEYAIYDSVIDHKAFDSYYWYYDPAITSVGNANTGQKFWGTDSKYLMRKVIGSTWGAGNTVSTFEYTMDSQQRVTEAKTYDYNGTLKNTDSYTYY